MFSTGDVNSKILLLPARDLGGLQRGQCWVEEAIFLQVAGQAWTEASPDSEAILITVGLIQVDTSEISLQPATAI